MGEPCARAIEKDPVAGEADDCTSLAVGVAAVVEDGPGDAPVVCVCPEWLLPAWEHPATSNDRAISAVIRIPSG